MIRSFRKTIFFLWCFLASPAAATDFPGPYFGDVIRVIDGDTFEAKVEIWPTISATVNVRLKGIDAPELNRSKCPQEKIGAMDARDAMVEIIPPGTQVRLENVENGSFAGRVIADVFRQVDVRGRTLIELLRNRDAPVCPWIPGQPDIDWCGEMPANCWN